MRQTVNRLGTAFKGLPALAAGALTSLPVLAQPAYADGREAWHYGWGWGHMLFGSLMMVLFWGGVILVVVLVVRWLGSGGDGKPGPGQAPSAIRILEERFARGEIDKEEFEERKRLLSG